MASLDRHTSGVYRLRFRFGGRQWYRSLETQDEQEAQQIKSRVERTLQLLKAGDVSLPPGVTAEQTWLFIMSGGRIVGEFDVPLESTLGDAIDRYFRDMPDGAKEESSLCTERIHAKHLRKILGRSAPLESIGVDQLQSYVNRRAKSVAPYTIRKEVGTYHQVWSHAKARGLVTGECPKRHLKFPKSPEKPPFQTYDQIKRAIRNGADEGLWDALFLRESEVLGVLKYAQGHAAHLFIPPMLALAAVGLRRSEILRSEVADLDLDRGVVLVREKKRVKSSSMSFRRVDVPVSPAPFVQILRDWLDQHPGGKYTICAKPNEPLTSDSARGYLHRTLGTLLKWQESAKNRAKEATPNRESSGRARPKKKRHPKWSKIRGFHVFRHSFASICAMKGIHPSIIDAWLGHQTEEMRRRYRHLFPEETQAARLALFNGETA